MKHTLLAGLIGLALVSSSQAGMITTPLGLNPGDQFRVVFLTDGMTDALSGDHSVYDSIVAGEALSAGITTYGVEAVSWRALISSDDGTVARDRLPADNIPIYLLDGTEVIDSATSLWGPLPLYTGISLTPSGNHIHSIVWTGTSPLGYAAAAHPLGSGPLVTAGDSIFTDTGWIDSMVPASSDIPYLSLYGFSNVLTVPAAPVPEPSSLALLGIGAVGLVGYGWRRKRKLAA